MKLGFIGTGEITAAMVTGLSRGDGERHSIRLSPRNSAIAADLCRRFAGVSIASSNQEVLDSCEGAVIAVRPPIADAVLTELRFRPDHCVISVVSSLSLRSLARLVSPATQIARAVPLPSTAKGISPTAVYPRNAIADRIFARLGTVLNVESEREFDAICAATATIASFYAFMDAVADWLSRNGIRPEAACEYVARMVLGLSSGAADLQGRSFAALTKSHATTGGINEQFFKNLAERGVFEIVSEGLDAVLHRISAAG